MEFGGWRLIPEILENLRELGGLESFRDAYSYITKFKDPCYGGWFCPDKSRISNPEISLSFRYCNDKYSPTEELADAYALFVTNNDHFEEIARNNSLVGRKYEFMQKYFSKNSRFRKRSSAGVLGA